MAELKLTIQGKALDCGKCDDALLWVHNPTLLVQNVGVVDPALIDPFIEAEITDLVAVKTGTDCNGVDTYDYVYTLEYDEALLVTPTDLLNECDIRQLCCASCVVKYLQVRVANLEDIIATMQTDIAANTAAIAANAANIATNTTDISTNAGDITALDARVTAHETAYP